MKFIDIAFLMLLTLFATITYIQMAEWDGGAKMDAANYKIIAYDFINDTRFTEDFSYLDDNYDCPSGYKCIDGVGYPQYLHLYPALLGIGSSIAEGIGPAVVQVMIACAALIAFYYLVRIVFNEKLAFISSLIFMFMPLQILYSKEMMSEVLAQLLLFLALISFFYWRKSQRKYFHYLEIVFYILLLLTKIDAILVLIPIGVIYTWLSYSKKITLKDILPFFLLIFVALYYYTLAGDYTLRSYWNDIKFPFLATAITIFPFILLLVHLLLTKLPQKIGRKIHLLLTPSRIRYILILTITIILVGIIYRASPYIQQILNEIPVEFDGPEFEKVNILRITYFIPATVLVASLFGFAVLVFKEKLTTAVVIFSLLLALCMTLLVSQHSAPIYWWGRRYLLFGVPIVSFLSAYLLYILFISKNLLRVLSLILIPLLFVPLLIWSGPAFAYKQNSGLDEQVYDFAVQVNPNMTLLMKKTWQYTLIGPSVSSIYDKDIRMYKEFKEIDVEGLDEVILISDPDLQIDQSKCRAIYFDYTYYLADRTLCGENELFCKWDDTLELYQNEFGIPICEISKEELIELQNEAPSDKE